MLATLFARKAPEPSYPTLPAVDDHGETSVPGLFVVGESAGTPLLKLGLNQGAKLARKLAADRAGRTKAPGVHDVVVVGAGASGLSLALQARALGLDVVLLDARRAAQTVRDMTKGKHLFAEPHAVKTESPLWFEECTKEQLLARWDAQVAASGVALKEHERVVDVARRGDRFDVVTEKATYPAARVVLAVGKAGNPRKAGVPGEVEHGDKVLHALADADAYVGKRVIVYGGGDVACEAAIALAAKNDVVMITIDRALTFPKKRNREAVEALAAAGRLQLRTGAKLDAIGPRTAAFTTSAGESVEVENDVVFEMIGADPPIAFFRKVGVQLEGAWTVKKWLALAATFLFVYSLYALKKYPEAPYAWPFTLFVDDAALRRVVGAAFDVAFLPFSWLFTAQARADIGGALWFQQGYLYSALYTVIMIVFGVEAMRRWTRTAKDPTYQRWRYASLIAFQVGFFLIANVIAVQSLSLSFAWRAWGLYQPWPLFFHTFHWWNESDPRAVLWFFVGAGLFGTFVAIPLAARRHGKRFCTWVCGCGGLAETLADRWRHLAPKGKRSRAWEFQGAVILAAATMVTIVCVGMYGARADNAWGLAYSYVVDFWLCAVIPIALYPFFGGKVWCRYWCPLAAWNQILARWYGKLGIAADDKCITCGQCSKQCQVGVDVMSFAKNGATFTNKESSCIHCGVCIDVCPVDVLSFVQIDRPKKRA